MTIFYVTQNMTNRRVAVNTNKVSRILDTGPLRELHSGTGNASSEDLSIKETLSKVLADTKFTKVTNANTKKGAAVNGALVSYVLEHGSFRELWFGPNRSAMVSPQNTSTLTVTENMTYLNSNLGLALVTENNSGKKIAVNPNIVYKVLDAGITRNLYFSSPTIASTAIITVKETVAQLARLGIV